MKPGRRFRQSMGCRPWSDCRARRNGSLPQGAARWSAPRSVSHRSIPWMISKTPMNGIAAMIPVSADCSRSAICSPIRSGFTICSAMSAKSYRTLSSCLPAAGCRARLARCWSRGAPAIHRWRTCAHRRAANIPNSTMKPELSTARQWSASGLHSACLRSPAQNASNSTKRTSRTFASRVRRGWRTGLTRPRSCARWRASLMMKPGVSRWNALLLRSMPKWSRGMCSSPRMPRRLLPPPRQSSEITGPHRKWPRITRS